MIKKYIVGVNIRGSVKYRVHYKGKEWSEEVTGQADDFKTAIDSIDIIGKTYRVYSKEKLFPYVDCFNIDDDSDPNGYAGLIGNEIYGLMVKNMVYQVV